MRREPISVDGWGHMITTVIHRLLKIPRCDPTHQITVKAQPMITCLQLEIPNWYHIKNLLHCLLFWNEEAFTSYSRDLPVMTDDSTYDNYHSGAAKEVQNSGFSQSHIFVSLRNWISFKSIVIQMKCFQYVLFRLPWVVQCRVHHSMIAYMWVVNDW